MVSKKLLNWDNFWSIYGLKRRQNHKKPENSLCPKFCSSVHLGFFSIQKNKCFFTSNKVFELLFILDRLFQGKIGHFKAMMYQKMPRSSGFWLRKALNNFFNVKSLGIQLKRRQNHEKAEKSLCPKFCGSVRLGFFQYTKTIAFPH